MGLNGKLPEPGEVLPVARPLALVPMPEGWRDQVAEATATWPARAQLDLVTDDDLDWGDDDDHGGVGLDYLLGLALLALAVVVPVLADRLVQL
jgi:hypothetical protein